MDNEKLYKEAREEIQKILSSGQDSINIKMSKLKLWLQPFFPELQEFLDERIRRRLCVLVNDVKDDLLHQYLLLLTKEETLTWLEKQGKPKGKSALEAIKEEKVDNANKVEPKDYSSIDPHFFKPVDKVEPKFHEGEWLCENEPNNYARFIQILEIVNVQGKERYRISRDIHNDDDIVEFDFVEKCYHKFDIKDARDGDVLFYRGNVKYSDRIKFDRILLFENLDKSFFVLTKYSNGAENYDINANIDYPDNIIPATKEQKEILFMVMKEAGYEWKAKTKELIKVPKSKESTVLDGTGNHEYADLGLPSGLLWAKCNVGAAQETDYGLYFAWGETEGYTDASGTKRFSRADYKFYNYRSDATNYGMTKYNKTDGKMTLDPEDDAAHVHMGDSWRMPTSAESMELYENTDHEWATINGVKGCKFMRRDNHDVYIFIPAAGYCYNEEMLDGGQEISIWSSSLYESYVYYAWYLYFLSGGIGMYYGNRYGGMSVRGVSAENSQSLKTTKADKVRNAPKGNSQTLDATGNLQDLYKTEENPSSVEDKNKPAELSEDDKNHIDSLLQRLDGLCANMFVYTRFAISEDEDWLKSLKERLNSNHNDTRRT